MIARPVLRAIARVVPRSRRREWLEEWEAELEALASLRARGEAADYPGVASFLAGALPHALWMRKEGWGMESLVRDIGFAGRVLRRSPVFTLVAALTLALGVGANAAIFSLVNGLMFRGPAGLEEPDRLVQIARSYDEAPRWDNWSWPAAEMIKDEAELLSGVAGYASASFILGRGEEVEPIAGQYVSGGYFEVLGVRPALGRLLGPGDEVAPGAHAVLVLSHGLWQRRFGGDPDVIGSVVDVGSTAYEVVGVAPPGFAGVDALGQPPEVFVPAMQRTSPSGVHSFDLWGSSWFYAFGRIRPGVSFEAAEASMDAVTMRLRDASDVNEDIRVLLAKGIGLTPEERAEGTRVSGLLSALAALVLLLTCANVGNLFLTRATSRAGEVGVRQALGAGRGRLVRQLLTESIVLAVVATVAAVPLVVLAGRFIPTVFPYALNVSLTPDLRVFAFLGAVGLAAGAVFGLAPAWTATRDDVATVLRDGGATGGKGRTRARDALVVAQLAISLGLVSGAALLGRSVLNARTADPGFEPDGLVIGFANLRATGRYDIEAMRRFKEQVLVELEASPGVTSVAVASQAPVLGGHSRATVSPADRPGDPSVEYEAEEVVVTSGYFETLGMSVLRGRTFGTPAEEPSLVVVVNQSLARLFWPDGDALDRELDTAYGAARVIGVVNDVQMRSLRAPGRPGVYYPHHLVPDFGTVVLHARTPAPVASIAPQLRRAVAAVDSEVPLVRITGLRDGLAQSLAETRTFGLLVTTLAGLALVLSLIGLYGMVAHTVAQRAREMGIRVALGAGGSTLVAMVLRRWGLLAVTGIVLGLAVSVALGRALEGALFGVSPTDPLMVGGAAVALFGVSLISAWFPARRVIHADAVVSLRELGG